MIILLKRNRCCSLFIRNNIFFFFYQMVFMPFAFYDVFASSWNHVGMIPAIAIICFLFFGIEEIAVSLEEPFSILPLDELVLEFQENAAETIEWMEEERDDVPNGEKRLEEATVNML